MATSKPGYGAVPPIHNLPPYIGAQSSTGQVLTASGMNGSSWMSQGITTAPTNAVQIGNPDPVVTFHMNGNITTPAGTISADDWIIAIQTIKQLVMDMGKDQELASKYPYIQDAAHTWFMKELNKGNNSVENENS